MLQLTTVSTLHDLVLKMFFVNRKLFLGSRLGGNVILNECIILLQLLHSVAVSNFCHYLTWYFCCVCNCVKMKSKQYTKWKWTCTNTDVRWLTVTHLHCWSHCAVRSGKQAPLVSSAASAELRSSHETSCCSDGNRVCTEPGEVPWRGRPS